MLQNIVVILNNVMKGMRSHTLFVSLLRKKIIKIINIYIYNKVFIAKIDNLWTHKGRKTTLVLGHGEN